MLGRTNLCDTLFSSCVAFTTPVEPLTRSIYQFLGEILHCAGQEVEIRKVAFHVTYIVMLHPVEAGSQT